jgi:hypothetical protein
MDPKNFLAELKRRNVYKVAVAYIVAGWALCCHWQPNGNGELAPSIALDFRCHPSSSNVTSVSQMQSSIYLTQHHAVSVVALNDKDPVANRAGSVVTLSRHGPLRSCCEMCV